MDREFQSQLRYNDRLAQMKIAVLQLPLDASCKIRVILESQHGNYRHPFSGVFIIIDADDTLIVTVKETIIASTNVLVSQSCPL